MKTTKKMTQKSWFKPTVIVIGVVIIVLTVKIILNNPFENFIKNFGNKDDQKQYNMEDIITENDPYIGNSQAAVKIVEFGDFACPYCKVAYPIIREVALEYNEDVFYQFRDFPVVSEQSIWLAMAGNCAHEQGKFWAVHDLLYEKQGEINELNIYSEIPKLGIDTNKFKNCLQTERFKNEVLEDFLSGEKVDVTGTPTVFINGMRFQGAPTKENLKKIIDQIIAYEGN